MKSSSFIIVFASTFMLTVSLECARNGFRPVDAGELLRLSVLGSWIASTATMCAMSGSRVLSWRKGADQKPPKRWFQLCFLTTIATSLYLMFGEFRLRLPDNLSFGFVLGISILVISLVLLMIMTAERQR